MRFSIGVAKRLLLVAIILGWVWATLVMIERHWEAFQMFGGLAFGWVLIVSISKPLSKSADRDCQ